MTGNVYFLGGHQKRRKGISSYITRTLLGAKKGWERIHKPCVLECSAQKGIQSDVGLSPLLSRGPKSGRNSYITPAISGVTGKGDESQVVASPFGAQKWVELLPNPGLLRGSPKKGTKSEVVASPLPSREPRNGHICYATPMFSWVLEGGDKIRSGNTTTGFSGAKNRVDWLHNPYLLGGSQE